MAGTSRFTPPGSTQPMGTSGLTSNPLGLPTQGFVTPPSSRPMPPPPPGGYQASNSERRPVSPVLSVNRAFVMNNLDDIIQILREQRRTEQRDGLRTILDYDDGEDEENAEAETPPLNNTTAAITPAATTAATSGLSAHGQPGNFYQGYPSYPNYSAYQHYPSYPSYSSYQSYQGYPGYPGYSGYQGYPNQVQSSFTDPTLVAPRQTQASHSAPGHPQGSASQSQFSAPPPAGPNQQNQHSTYPGASIPPIASSTAHAYHPVSNYGVYPPYPPQSASYNAPYPHMGGIPPWPALNYYGGMPHAPQPIGGPVPNQNDPNEDPSHHYLKDAKTPFIKTIQDQRFPKGTKIPSHLGYYEGKNDPEDHLREFEGAAKMQDWPEAIACHAFSYRLKGDARSWFDNLKPNTVTSFEDLKKQFLSYFSQQKKHTKSHVAAHNIKQKESESSRAFLSRYTNETQQIPGLPESQRISGLIHGSRVRPLVEFLNTDLPDTYQALLDRAYIWLDAKETAATGIGSPSNERDSSNFKRKQMNEDRRNDRKFTPYGKESNTGILSTLVKTPKEILATEKAATTFKTPGKMINRGKSRDFSKFCDFHNDYGHDTNDCRELKAAIEEAVKTGKLQHLIKGIRQQKPKVQPDEESEAKKKTAEDTTIYMVRSGIPNNKRKSVEKGNAFQSEISFPPLIDTIPSMDPVVIDALVFDRSIDQVYLDGGSECDIMYEHCFLRLPKIVQAHLKGTRTTLTGFSGERAWPLGKINLDVTIGIPPRTRTEILEFIVVRSPSPYNVLLGRSAMQRLGMIVSTAHSMVKFQTPRGIGTILSTYNQTKRDGEAKKIQRMVLDDPYRPPNRNEQRNRDIYSDLEYDMRQRGRGNEPPLTIGDRRSTSKRDSGPWSAWDDPGYAPFSQRTTKRYNKSLQSTTLKYGDLVFRLNTTKASHNQDLEPVWEGPYQVYNSYGNGVYKLGKMNDTPGDRS